MQVDSVENRIHLKKIKNKKQKQYGIFSLPQGAKVDAAETQTISSSKIPTLNPFLALQEIDDSFYSLSDTKVLLDEGNTLIECLNQIRFGLINGELNQNNIRTLKEIIEKKKYKFNTKEAEEIYEEIYMRACVELAKLERSKSK